MKNSIKNIHNATVMKFAAAILLGLLAVSTVQGKSFDPWEMKTRELEVRFEKVVDRKAMDVVNKVKAVVANEQGSVKDFFKQLEQDINATIALALKEIEVLKLDVTFECYKNATKDVLAAQEAAMTNLMGCQNLSNAYQDVQKIAQNASAVVLDVVKDAQLIIQGVDECSADAGVVKYECVLKYVALEIQNLVSQWPDAKQFIAVVKTLGSDVELQVNTCLQDPTQKSLDEKIQEALAEYSACSQKSAVYVV